MAVQLEVHDLQEVLRWVGYRIKLDREDSRWLKSVNGENKDFY